MTTHNVSELNFTKLKSEIKEFKKLLKNKAELEENKDIRSFFESKKNLCLFLAFLNSDIAKANYSKCEFLVNHNQYRADLTTGDSEKGIFCLFEFEDAKSNSIFSKKKASGKSDYAPRIFQGLGQITDWLKVIDDFKNIKSSSILPSESESVSFEVFLIIGRDSFLNVDQKKRLRWFQNNLTINVKRIKILTYDELFLFVSEKFKTFETLKSSLPVVKTTKRKSKIIKKKVKNK